ncbi:hypothetical protein FQZ97_1090890 [compost metagenome]
MMPASEPAEKKHTSLKTLDGSPLRYALIVAVQRLPLAQSPTRTAFLAAKTIGGRQLPLGFNSSGMSSMEPPPEAVRWVWRTTEA